MARYTAFALVFCFVLACSSSSTPDAPVGPTPPAPGTQADLDKATAARIAAYCERLFSCCDADSKQKLLALFAGGDVTRDKCEAGVKEWLKTSTSGAATAIQRATLDYYPSKEETCVREEEAKSCSEFFALGESSQPQIACKAAFTGKAKEGAGCIINAVCESGYCKLADDGESGLCAKFPEEGDACGNGNECGGGELYCHRTSAPPKCGFVQGTCKPRVAKASGESCCGAEECASRSCVLSNKGQPICTSTPAIKCDK